MKVVAKIITEYNKEGPVKFTKEQLKAAFELTAKKEGKVFIYYQPLRRYLNSVDLKFFIGELIRYDYFSSEITYELYHDVARSKLVKEIILEENNIPTELNPEIVEDNFFKYYPKGIGEIDPQGNVTDFELLGVNVITNKSIDKLKRIDFESEKMKKELV